MKGIGVLVMATSFTLLLAQPLQYSRNLHTDTGAIQVLNSVFETSALQESFAILISGKNTQLHGVAELRAPWGIGLFEVADGIPDANISFSRMVSNSLKLRRVSWSVTVVVVSDDPAFLAEFTGWAMEGLLLVWSTKLLVLTRLPLHRLNPLRHTLAITNSMLLHLSDNPSEHRCNVYLHLPYNTPEVEPVKVATWTPRRGLILKLAAGPKLAVSYLKVPTTKIRIVDDPDAPGGKRVVTLSPEITLLETIAEAMNFTINFFTPVDGGWGVKLPNGSWNGMLGMAKRKEVDIGLGLFHITPARAEAVDLTFPALQWYVRVIVRRGEPEVDPWGFLLPLTPLVWVSVLMTLLAVVVALIMIQTWIPGGRLSYSRLMVNTGSCVRVLLHQDVEMLAEWWWWERVVLGVWMLMTLVLTQSYAGNLMSLLAVRYISLPIQSLQDILDNPVTVLVPRGTTVATSFLAADQGILREVGDLQDTGRFNTIKSSTYVTNLDTLVRSGSHVLITVEARTKMLIAQDFSKSGRCDFYLAREEIIPMMFGLAGHKGSPLVPAISRVIMRLTEAGLYYYWLQLYTPNFTSCLNPPTKVAVRSSLSITNIWGMLVLVAGGVMASLFLFGVELLYDHLSPAESTT